MSPRHWGADDPELLPARPSDVGELPLFAEPPKPWPQTAPRGDAEQTVMPIKGTIEERYQAWRATATGEAVYQTFCRIALEKVAAGATRLGSKSIWEKIREIRQEPINNSFTAPIAREAERNHPTALGGKFEMRQRKAS